MQESKKVDPLKYFIVLVFTIAIFISGIFIGSLLTQEKIDQLGNFERDLRLDTLGVELQYSILAERPCEAIDTDPLTDELYKISERLDFMEAQLGRDNDDVLNLKNYYSLLEIRHWLLLQRTEETCNQNFTLVKYFYSNEGDCDECEQQGVILTYLRKKYPSLRIYPYDINLENPALNTLKQLYEVEQAPTIIIDDEVFPYYLTKTELEVILESKNVSAKE